MNLSFYTASVGAYQQQQRLDVHANNIANLNTYGFRARVPGFTALISGEVRGIDEDYQRGLGARMISDEMNLESSGMAETGRILDFAIYGSGYFMLRDSATDQVTYTRDGSFTLMQYGPQTENNKEFEVDNTHRWYLSDGSGRFVLNSRGQPIEFRIEKETDLAEIDFRTGDYKIGIFDWINHDGMTSDGSNQLGPVEKNGQIGLGTGNVVQGFLELSNTDFANEMTKVIEAQRSYQMMLRMVTTSDEIETTVNSLR